MTAKSRISRETFSVSITNFMLSSCCRMQSSNVASLGGPPVTNIAQAQPEAIAKEEQPATTSSEPLQFGSNPPLQAADAPKANDTDKVAGDLGDDDLHQQDDNDDHIFDMEIDEASFRFLATVVWSCVSFYSAQCKICRKCPHMLRKHHESRVWSSPVEKILSERLSLSFYLWENSNTLAMYQWPPISCCL